MAEQKGEKMAVTKVGCLEFSAVASWVVDSAGKTVGKMVANLVARMVVLKAEP